MTKLCSCGCGKLIRQQSTWAKGHNRNKRKDRFDWSNVSDDYQRFGTLEAVADHYGCTLQAVHHQLKKRGIDSSNEIREWSSLPADYERLKSVVKIAKEYRCSYRTVVDRLNRIQDFKVSHDDKSLDIAVGLGRYGELIALGLLNEAVDMNQITIQYPYDIEWRGLRVDVKTSRKRMRANEKINFSFKADNHQCDYYLMIALDDMNYPVKFLFIPRTEVTGVSVSYTPGRASKWDKFEMEVDQNEIERIVRDAKSIRSENH